MASKILQYIDKDHIQLYNNLINKEDFNSLFINNNYSEKDLCDYYNVSRSTIQRIISFFDIHKSKQQSNIISQNTCLKKYGTRFYTQTQDYKNKTIDTSQKKYGVEYFTQSSNIKQKYRDTCLKKYGVTTTAILPEVINKKNITCIEKYGVRNPMQNQKTQKKLQNVFIKKYGTSAIMSIPKFLKKSQDTCKQKYGVTSYSKTTDFKQRVKQSAKDYSQRNWPEATRELLNSKEQFIIFLQAYTKKPTAKEVAAQLQCSISALGDRIREWDLYEYFTLSYGRSSYESEIQCFLENLHIKIIRNSRILQGREIDIYLPDYRIGIEFNGTYWHSLSVINDKKYHFKKSLLAQENGIRLIHIYEYEWENKTTQSIIKSLLRVCCNKIDSPIYARKCVIKKITNKEAKAFNDCNHLQGHRNAQVTYGLFYNNELVQLMSFCKTKYNKNLNGINEWEIIRGCPGSNNIVVGGVSKLFKHFIREYKPNKIFSYCDFNKFDGKGYEAIGMKFVGYTGPDMKWILKDRTVVSRCPAKHTELKSQSIDQIWGAGSKKYVWYANK